MQDLLSRLKSLRRPRLLVRTARIGAATYSRSRDLSRIMDYGKPPRPAAAIVWLLDSESEINQQRLSRDSSYSLICHVEILVALVGEAALLAPPNTRPQAQGSIAAGAETDQNENGR
ncbi:hypothetical protein AN476_12640 [Phaeobacter sp. 11ANDIMAR09]|nr:DUF6477 family protein [Phaeobacter sp. 11ANDIMAR09]KPD12029.1 hypothetical protein AN476_12640 [Phaeobacter sp. 11ANDIMAR09]